MNKKIRQLWHKLRANRRLSILIAGGILVLVLITAGIGLYFSGILVTESRAEEEPEEMAKARIAQTEQDGKLRDSASKEVASGNVSGAEKLYEDAIAKEAESTRKIELAIDQSEVLYAAGKYSEAIAVAKKAEGVSEQKFLIADWLARVYEDQKQYNLSAEYYRLAAKSAGSPQNQTGITSDMYEKEALRVLGLKKEANQ